MSTTRARKASPSLDPLKPQPASAALSAAAPSLSSRHFWLLLLAAAAALAAACYHISYGWALVQCGLLAWIFLHRHTPRTAFLAGLGFGSVGCMLLNAWMLPVILHYAGGSVLAAGAAFAAGAGLLGLLFGVQFAGFAALRLPEGRRGSLLVNGVLFAATWVAFEWLRAAALPAFPWLSFAIGSAGADHVYLIQAAAWGGVPLLSFLLVLTAWFGAAALRSRQPGWLFASAGILGAQLVSGWGAYRSIQQQTAGNRAFSVALVQPALPAGAAWDETDGDRLVSGLLALGAEALRAKPDLVLWTETLVPWTYRADDDFIKELLRPAAAAGSHSLLGMNMPQGKEGDIANAALLFAPSGKVLARYDKQLLLAVVERPLFGAESGLILPYVGTSGQAMVAGSAAGPVPTPWGAAAVLICNESTSPAAARRLVHEGATYLVNMGNDAWFAGNYISRQHTANARIRAVENRKDILLNNNGGGSGVFRASGEQVTLSDGSEAGLQLATVQPNELPPAPAWIFPALLLLVSGGCLSYRFLSTPNR